MAHTRGPDVDPVEAAAVHAVRGAVLLDVREPQEWADGHIAGAVLSPLSDLRPELLDPSIPVIAVCRSGNRSGTAADILAAAGFDVRNMLGGMLAWEEAGLAIQREPASRQ